MDKDWKKLCTQPLSEFLADLKKEDKEKNRWRVPGGARIKKVYKEASLEWHEPKNEKEKRWWGEHEEILAKVRKTGKCPCGASVKEGSGNYLQDLGYIYGVECLSCR